MNFNIIFATTVLPNKKTGGEIATAQIISALRNAGHTVKVLGFIRPHDTILYQEDDIVIDCKYIESTSSKLYSLYSLFKSFITNKPYSCAKYISRKYIGKLRGEIATGKYDLLIVDHGQMSWILSQKNKLPVILIEHNVEFDLYRKLWKDTSIVNFFLKWLYFREYKLMYVTEKRSISMSDQVWTLNDTDKINLENSFDANNINSIHIPGGFDNFLDYKEKEYSVTMLGTWSWEANKKGLEWFVECILPLLDKKIDIHVGGIGAKWLKDKHLNVIYHGFVDNAQKFLSKSRCIIVPSTSGSGIQIKTLDAISTGLPVIATSIAVRGIENLPKHVYVIDDAMEFANKIESILKSKQIYTDGFVWSVERKSDFEKTLKSCCQDVVKTQ